MEVQYFQCRGREFNPWSDMHLVSHILQGKAKNNLGQENVWLNVTQVNHSVTHKFNFLEDKGDNSSKYQRRL